MVELGLEVIVDLLPAHKEADVRTGLQEGRGALVRSDGDGHDDEGKVREGEGED